MMTLGIGLGSCPMTSSGSSGVEAFNSATAVSQVT